MPYLGRTVVTNLADFHVDNYAAGGGFTAGSTTQLTLTVAGIDDEEALSIFFDGVHQAHDSWVIANSVVTFDTAIPSGVAAVEIHYGKQPVASALAANVIDSEHYVDGSIDLAHMSSQSVDEDNLHISNSGSNGQFLSKQSGDAGGLTWAAAGGNLVYSENTGTTVINSTTYADVGQGYSVSITPKTTSSKILIMALVRHQANWGALLMNYIRILDADDTVHGEAGEIARDGGSTAGTFHTTLFCIDEPGSTSEQTYRVQSKNYGSVTAYIGEGGDSQMIAMEI